MIYIFFLGLMASAVLALKISIGDKDMVMMNNVKTGGGGGGGGGRQNSTGSLADLYYRYMPTDPIVSVSGFFVQMYSQLNEYLDKTIYTLYEDGDGDVESMVVALRKGFDHLCYIMGDMNGYIRGKIEISFNFSALATALAPAAHVLKVCLWFALPYFIILMAAVTWDAYMYPMILQQKRKRRSSQLIVSEEDVGQSA